VGVLGQPPRGVERRLLDHVRRIDAPAQAMVEPHRHHASQAIAVRSEQRVPGAVIALHRLVDELQRVVGMR
jgi:hypothetical protein